MAIGLPVYDPKAFNAKRTEKAHQGRCLVCKHPQKLEIEEMYISGSSPDYIAKTVGNLPGQSIWRHAVYYSMDKLRQANALKIASKIINRCNLDRDELDSAIKAVALKRILEADRQVIAITNVQITPDAIADKREDIAKRFNITITDKNKDAKRIADASDAEIVDAVEASNE